MEAEKIQVDQSERNDNTSSGPDIETQAVTPVKETVQPTALPNEARDEDVVTLKTWIVVVILSCSYGLSFWMVTSLAACQTFVATQLGNPANSAWWTTVYTMCNAISFMLFGGNSDLFGRRWFIISGNVAVFVGYIVIGSAKSTEAIIAGSACIGVGAGLCQLAAFALPELLPNRIRHIGILIADASTWVAVLFGPIVGRYSMVESPERWRWLFYTPAILVAISFTLLVLLYFPPKHPRGIPWHEAVRQLDYLGAFLFTTGATLVFTGVIYTTIIPASSKIVIGLLCSGFGVVVIFALYERFGNLKQPLTPWQIFNVDRGAEFTFPFISGMIVNMFFYSVNIVYPTMIDVFWTTTNTSVSYACQLTLPQGLGLITGSMILWFFGNTIGHWKIQYIASFAVMTLFGALLALGKPSNMGMVMAFVFICEMGYGWAQTLSIMWIQFGVPQTQLGISGALAGVARWTGGALSSSIYLAILSNVQGKQARKLIPAAAIAAGANTTTADAMVAAIGLGAAAAEAVPGATTSIIEAAAGAFTQSYVVGLRTVCLVSIAFGVIGTICCALSNDIGPKMTRKIEVFLENDVQKDKNRFH
ncbi:Fungal trichothecene efflux pump [Niveomyces insectorum RCEF 264]|uniref:Fungal trichothecene efflux pump n=1 Tax=Niveomyces insectorum RCEF 264 TaxID=1081102 RepID=A0A167WCP3_9HYPO|nr:Fungal trichothecene efflux pump [Niveomyces insectorum RCEF 264]